MLPVIGAPLPFPERLTCYWSDLMLKIRNRKKGRKWETSRIEIRQNEEGKWPNCFSSIAHNGDKDVGSVPSAVDAEKTGPLMSRV